MDSSLVVALFDQPARLFAAARHLLGAAKSFVRRLLPTYQHACQYSFLCAVVVLRCTRDLLIHSPSFPVTTNPSTSIMRSRWRMFGVV